MADDSVLTPHTGVIHFFQGDMVALDPVVLSFASDVKDAVARQPIRLIISLNTIAGLAGLFRLVLSCIADSMENTIRYLTHPQVAIDPNKDVPKWSLNEIGAARVTSLVNSGALKGTSRIISSAETKALETAGPLAASLGIDLEVRPLMHENDRSATGFLVPNEFETVADQFFAVPDKSARGWETARDAQDRIVREVSEALSVEAAGDVLFVGHGAVGTLLYCALCEIPIERKHDQGPGGGGCYFSFSSIERKPKFGWRPMERLYQD